jgi:CRP-like cAMP-binding protein
VRGSVGIFLPNNETKTPDFVIGANEIFGEMGVIDDELRMADARCMEECDIISVTKDEFNAYLDESNIFVRGVVGILSERLRNMQKSSR